MRAILGDVQRGINTSVMLTEEAVKRAAAGKERTETTHAPSARSRTASRKACRPSSRSSPPPTSSRLGIEQVMGALQNIRQASQQTAAGTRQLNEAAGNLAGLSQQLLALSDRYKL